MKLLKQLLLCGALGAALATALPVAAAGECAGLPPVRRGRAARPPGTTLRRLRPTAAPSGTRGPYISDQGCF